MDKKTKTGKTMEQGVAKVPLIMQLEALECGAASLAMVMAYYGKWVPLEQVRRDCGVSRDGSSARNIIKAAENYGFRVTALRRTPDSFRQSGRYPCIIHWNFSHFVVLNGFKKGYAFINDPARGNVKVSPEEFDSSFTGITITPEPGPDFRPGGQPKSLGAFIRKRLTGAGAAIAFVILSTVISSMFGFINPAMSRIFMDRLLTGTNPEWLTPFIWIMIGLAALQILTTWVQVIYSLKISGKLAVTGSTSYMWKLLSMPMEFFTQRSAGDLQSRQGANAGIAATLVSTFAPMVINLALVIVYLGLMLNQSLLLTAVGVSTMVINIFMSRIISKKRVNITRVSERDRAMLFSSTASGIRMVETIKASGAENGFFQRWAGYQASVNTQEIKSNRLDNFLGAVPPLLASLANYAVILLGAWLMMNGQFTLGALQMFQGFLGSFMSPALQLLNAGQSVQEMRTQMERVDDVMEYPSDVPGEKGADGGSMGKLKGRVELRHVTFGYSRLAEPLIRDFSMTVEPGHSVAFIGASGCGKSTLSRLISGLYNPWEGEILFDGKPRAEISRAVLTGSVAVVDQDITLFEGTIAENIRMWDDSIMDFEVVLAARDAQIHEDILAREGGYQSRLATGGSDLSGGQRQRLEIARVLAQDPVVIILDEATSALDARTEAETVKAIRDRGITCIVIAHRLSTIRDCDEIIVLDRGTVAERGTHAELMKRGGAYAELVTGE